MKSTSRRFKLAFKYKADEYHATSFLQVKQIHLMFHRSTVKPRLKLSVKFEAHQIKGYIHV